MAHYVGIDASLETVNVCVVDDDGTVCLESKIEAEPEAIIELLKNFGQPIARLGLEAGPTASWLFSELRAAGNLHGMQTCEGRARGHAQQNGS